MIGRWYVVPVRRRFFPVWRLWPVWIAADGSDIKDWCPDWYVYHRFDTREEADAFRLRMAFADEPQPTTIRKRDRRIA